MSSGPSKAITPEPALNATERLRLLSRRDSRHDLVEANQLRALKDLLRGREERTS